MLSECSELPVTWLARVQVEEIPSPYMYSPTVRILEYRGKQVIIFEVRHRRYEMFEVPANLLRFKTEQEAEDWHIRFSHKAA